MTMDNLKEKYPEGIPPWMLQRGMSANEIDKLMQLRRKAFPKTRTQAGKGKSCAS